MVIVKIVGDLGNQMFQYAYAKTLQQNGYQVKIDIPKINKEKPDEDFQLETFKIDLESSTSLVSFLSKLGFKKSIKEKSLLFNKKILEAPKKGYVKGRFQTEKYFAKHRTILLKQFIIKEELSNSTLAYLKEITIQKNCCSIHIKKGMYISDKKENNIDKTSDLNYYKKAIKLVRNTFKNCHFFIFSDDIPWAKKNLKINNSTYIDHDVIPHENLHLMSLCNHNITANNSFSWWGAWLNQHKNKTVITPKNWFINKENEIACANWIQL